jgi:molecular chaperone GrpE (heat shock protein)
MSKLAATILTAWSTPFKSISEKAGTMNKPVARPDDFAAAMQQLSAEAKKSIMFEQNSAGLPGAASSLEERVENLEATLSKKMDELLAAVRQNRPSELALKFRQIDEQLAAIRNSETVNQRLFDSLHEELLKYRDNFVHESLQKPFIHDLLHLYDDLTSLANQLRSSAHEQKAGANLLRWRDNLENAIHSLMELLHRLDVEEVEPLEKVDRALHRVVSYEPADFPEDDGRIVMRVKRGFVWRDTLIRPEEVIAKRYG